MEKTIYLPKTYKLVVGDKFELFYRGIIKAFNPYKYYIRVRCNKGKPYPRYFTFTPTVDDVGSYLLTVEIVDDDGVCLEKEETTLVVNNYNRPDKKTTILCIGDSLTSAGYWTMEGYRRFSQTEGTPVGLGFNNTIELIGLCKKVINGEEIGYEGYGGWQWKTFCGSDIASKTSSIWVNVSSHNKTEADQHSVWKNCENFWILETIEEKRLKFKRGINHTEIAPKIDNTFTHFENATNKEGINILSYEYESGNPFWSKDKNDIDFLDYIERNNFNVPEYVYILLTWNGLYLPFNNDFSIHNQYGTHFLDKLHQAFPKAIIKIMSIEIPSVTGGFAASYGAHGYYSDSYGEVCTAFNYCNWLKELCERDNYKDYMEYIDVKGQFDSEYNMPYSMEKVNARSTKLELLGNNAVHPNLDGYMQIGDVFYRSLVDVLCKK